MRVIGDEPDAAGADWQVLNRGEEPRFHLWAGGGFGSPGGRRAANLFLVRELLLNEEIYERVVEDLMLGAQRFLWIVTADIKDLHVVRGKRAVALLEMLAGLVEDGVAVRLIHAKEPGPRFRQQFDRHPVLVESEAFERVLCPRVHTKAVIVDGKRAFVGSPNLTGAGMGAKHPDKRNFEAGYLTDEREDVKRLMDWVDELFLGDFCGRCRLRDRCPDPLG